MTWLLGRLVALVLWIVTWLTTGWRVRLLAEAFPRIHRAAALKYNHGLRDYLGASPRQRKRRMRTLRRRSA